MRCGLVKPELGVHGRKRLSMGPGVIALASILG